MKYIALLRGINVGGNNKISMRELKACFDNAGFLDVRTYINSENVIFNSDEHDLFLLSKICEEAIELQFKLPIRVALIEANALKETLEHALARWGMDTTSKHNAIFIIPPATAEGIIADVGDINPEYEQLDFNCSLMFWSAKIETFSRTRWSKTVDKKSYQDITIRNINTTRRLLELDFS